MKKFLMILSLSLCLALPACAAEEFKDFIFRGMPDYKILNQTRNFERLEIRSAKPESTETERTTYEGNRVWTNYYYQGDASARPSHLQALRYYKAGVEKLGGEILWEDESNLHASFERNSKQYYMTVGFTSSTSTGDIYVTILELAGLEQDVDILDDDDFFVEDEIIEDAIVEEEKSAEAEIIVQKLEEEGFVTLYINFDSGKYTIKPESYKIIDDIAAALRAKPDMKVKLEGHTDNVGNARANKKLSDDRAKAVMNAIVAKGIDSSRLVAEGFGLEKPIADNNTAEGRAQNRRVELVRVD